MTARSATRVSGRVRGHRERRAYTDPAVAAGALASSVRRRGLAPAAEPQAERSERKRRPAARHKAKRLAACPAAVEARTAACRAQQGPRSSHQSGADSDARSDEGAQCGRDGMARVYRSATSAPDFRAHAAPSGVAGHRTERSGGGSRRRDSYSELARRVPLGDSGTLRTAALLHVGQFSPMSFHRALILFEVTTELVL